MDMATRRNRIKGIANIPQRRKVENVPNVDVDFENRETSVQIGSGSISSEKKLSDVQTIESKESIAQTDTLNELISTEQELNVKTIDKCAEIVKPDTDVTVKNECNSDSNSLCNKNANEDSCKRNETAIKSSSLTSATEETASSDPVIVTTRVDNEIYSEVIALDLQCTSKSNSSTNTQNTNFSTPTSQRRTFIKPKINIKSLSQKLKPKLCNIDPSPEIKEPPTTAAKDSEPVCNPPSEVQILPTIHNQISDSENITEPPSPTKILNRSRIKAIPRLHQRRISATIHGSASESEEDTRKSYKRVKTDSICSTTSSICEPPAKNNPDPPPQNKDISSIVQRKCRRSEQSCKMSEARRNFQNKFRNQAPEKQKLTMYDLIFYNPATKPMTQKLEQSDNTEDKTLNSPTNCDSPDSNVESEGDNVPAPQIKIGKNGEIIVDEKSLIVENKQTKINRENLKKSDLVNGDFDTGYGVYKRVRRTKDWNKEDTLFFYKALHTLGTDFSLMAQLFPGRTRRELKMKFKKEDRINHVLVDKALSQPLQFNIKELKQEAEHKRKQKELDELQKQKRSEELEQQHKNTIPYTCFGTKRSKESKHKKNVKKSRQKEDIYSKLEKGIASVWNSKSEDEQDSSDSSSEITVANILKRTQFGRLPTKKQIAQESTEATNNPAVPHKRRVKGLGEDQKRKRKELKYDENDVQKSNDKEDKSDQLDDGGVSSAWNSNSEDENGSSDSSAEVTVANILKQTRYGRIPNKKMVAQESTDLSTNPQTDQSKELEPGSVMITCQPTSKGGEPTFKVFMVTPTHAKVPIDFPSEVIDTFTKNIETSKREPSCEKTLEHNYTICHDEGGVNDECSTEEVQST